MGLKIRWHTCKILSFHILSFLKNTVPRLLYILPSGLFSFILHASFSFRKFFI